MDHQTLNDEQVTLNAIKLLADENLVWSDDFENIRIVLLALLANAFNTDEEPEMRNINLHQLVLQLARKLSNDA